MRWDFSHQAMAKRAAKKGGREPSSPFSIMNQAGLDGARIPTFDILLSFKIQKKNLLASKLHFNYSSELVPEVLG